MKRLLILQVEKKKRRTKTFSVISTYDGTHLGKISWFPKWKKCVFFPTTEYSTAWSDDCLIELCNFLKSLRRR